MLSNVGGVPTEVVHDCAGPGIAFSYQVAKSAAGGATTGAVWLTPIVAPSESLLKMLFESWLPVHVTQLMLTFW